MCKLPVFLSFFHRMRACKSSHSRSPSPRRVTRSQSRSKSPRTRVARPMSHAHGHHSEVVVQQHNDGTHVYINRPKKLNALDLPTATQLHQTLQSLVTDQTEEQKSKPIFISGAGAKAYCAGGDIMSLYSEGLKWKDHKDISGLHANQHFFKEEYTANLLLSQLPNAHAIMNGITFGGGVGMSTHAKVRTSTDKTLWAMPETAIGFFPDVGTSYTLSHLSHENGDAIGQFLGLTGTRLQGHDLVHLGLAEQYVEAKYLPHALPDPSKPSEPSGVETEKWQEKVIPHEKLPALSLTPSQMECIAACFNQTSVEKIIDSLKSYTADRDFAQQTLHTLNLMSPLSLKVTHQLLLRGKKLSLAQCLEQDYLVASHLLGCDDFYIGVKNVLIDKKRDERAAWSHNSVAEVPDNFVQSIFESHPTDDFVPLNLNDLKSSFQIKKHQL